MKHLSTLVSCTQRGEVEAFGRLVAATQAMAYAVARGVLRDRMAAEDAVQVAYLQAFRRIGELQEPAAFAGWLRRIVLTVALNLRRSRRGTFLRLDDVPEVPVLDETETHWSEAQRLRLGAALLTLSPDERQLCDRRYYGGWSTTRLAASAGVDPAVMRKRLQRIRDKLRKEIEMAEQRVTPASELRDDFPGNIVELLARPRLTDIPDNPVGQVLALLRGVFPECLEQVFPEVVNLSDALRTQAGEALYVEATELHRIDSDRILRYDLTLPLLMTLRYTGEPLRVWTSGKAYRLGRIDAKHLEAFHQAEMFWLDERAMLDPWTITGRVVQSLDRVLPGRTVRIVPTDYPMCQQAWELDVDVDGQWSELMAWGVFTDAIVQHLGGDPARHTAVGVGYGLERLAMVRYSIDDIRKVEVASVA
jgi:RNA polymerase sigma-70 factor (ECF subfamily)